MTARTTYVPLHSILVVRDGKQVDALAEYKRTGKAFKFEASEIKEITEAFDGNPALALREPSDEAAAAEVEAKAESQPQAASDRPTPTKAAADKAAADKAAAKDADL